MVKRPSVCMPANLAAGDRVAVLSPSFAGPATFPIPFELGLRRLREEFDLEPVEYPTTRKLGASAQERADDINQAFGDADISGVLTSLGGSDQIKVLKHLDRDVIASNPKAFVGYSDNTNLLHYLWRLGIVGYHGASVMVEVGRPGRMHPLTRESLHRALFTSGEFEVHQVDTGRDESRDWADLDTFDSEPELTPVDGWRWHGPTRRVLGPSWGGCLEIIDYHLRANRYLGPDDQYDGCVFFFETSEDMPSADYVYEVLMGMGERGLLQRFPAVVVGRPKAWSFATPNKPPEKERYRRDQEQAVLKAMREYHPDAVLLFNVDLGHTDPQVVIPYGGEIVVDAVNERLLVTY